MIHSFMFIYMDVVWGLIHKDLKTNPEYWTGIVALVALTYLVFSSWAVFRNKNYELFKK
jgi:DMSO/TMAO reductase YedYZ heme-binding membrane subunit